MRNHKQSRLIVVFLLFITLFSTPSLLRVFAAGLLTLDVNIAGAPDTVDVGEIIEYIIDFSCAGTTGDCGTLEIDFDFDNTLVEFVEVAPSSGYGGVLFDADTVRITDTSPPFEDGDASQAVVRVRVLADLDGGEVIGASVSGTVTAPDGSDTDSKVAPTVTVNPPTEQWSVTKTQVAPGGGVGASSGGQATYNVSFCPDSSTGNIALDNAQMIDTYPAGAIVIDADGGIDNGTTITWDLGTLSPTGGCETRTVTLEFPVASFPEGGSYDNIVEGYGEHPTVDTTDPTCGSPNCIGTDTYTGTIDPPTANPGQGKSGPGTAIVSPGGTSVFTLSMNLNAANVSVDNVILQDNLPPAFSNAAVPAIDILNIQSGTWNGGFTANVEYSLNGGAAWTLIGTVDGSANTTWTRPADFPSDVTNIRWVFVDSLPPGFNFNSNPNYRFEPNDDQLVAADYDDGSGFRDYDNCIVTTYEVDGTPDSTGQTCANVRLSDDPDDYANINFDKSASPGQVEVLQTVTFTVGIEITQEASGALINPTIEDVLPDYLTVQAGTVNATFPPIIAGDEFNQPQVAVNPVAGGNQVLIFWDGAPGSGTNLNFEDPDIGTRRVEVTFDVTVEINAPAGLETNEVTITSDSPNLFCQSGGTTTDADDIDSDGDTAEIACETDTDYEILEAAELKSQKWIRSLVPGLTGFLDSRNLDAATPACPVLNFGGNDYTRFPCVAQGVTGDDFEYLMRMQNTGLVPVNNYIMYDVLPHIGDTGVSQVLAGVMRDSEFIVQLTGPVTLVDTLNSATFVVEYNTAADYNSCRPEMSSSADETGWQGPGCDAGWVGAGAIGGAWDTVTSFRIVQTGGQLDAGETMHFIAPMQINPYDPPINDEDAETGEIAWNTYAQRFNNALSGSRLLTAEPRKVGIIVEERYSVGNRVWWDDGRGGGTANDGVINGGEVGIDGVTVQLWQDTTGNGTPDTQVGVDVTHDGGYYIFSDLDAGTYEVRIPATEFTGGEELTNFVSSTNNATNNIDSNDNGIDPTPIDDYSAGISSNVFTLERNSEPINEADVNTPPPTSGNEGQAGRGIAFEEDQDSDLTIDMGFYRPLSLGNRVWLDDGAGTPANQNNGLVDAGEVGIDDVEVNLYLDNGNGVFGVGDTLVDTDTTENGGYYLFDLLPPGTYFVNIDPDNFTFGATVAGDGPLARYISSTGNTGDTETDNDDNGVDPVPQGDQRTVGVFSEAIVLTDGAFGGDFEPDSETDLEPSNPNPNGRRSLPNMSELTVDFGFYEETTLMSLGNRVWIDDGDGAGGVANDGLINGAEVGIDGVLVNLYLDDNGDGIPDDLGAPGPADDILDTFTTQDGGYYLFGNLDPARYVVQLDPSNWAAGTGVLENYFSSTTINTENVDSNDNGTNQPTYADYVVNGIFSNSIQLVPQGEPIAGDDDAVSGTGSAYGDTTIADNNSDNTVDFGVYKLMSIGNRVWLDNSTAGADVPGDGIFNDATEAGIDGVVVELFLDNGNGVLGAGDTSLGTDTTAGGGYYLFDGLAAGNYFVVIQAGNFDAPADPLYLHISSDGVDGDNTDDSADNDDNGEDDLAPATNGIASELITLTQDGEIDTEADLEPTVGDGANVEPDNSDLTIDFGFFIPPMSIGNRVWFDTDGDGIFEPAAGEIGINGVEVELFLDDGATAGTFDAGDTSLGTDTTVTGPAGDGFYLFDNLEPGTYFVRINAVNFATGVLVNHISTATAAPLNDATNYDDNGIDPVFADYVTDGVISNPILLEGNTEPLAAVDEPVDDFNGRGGNEEDDDDSNLTVDFGFFQPVAIGNRVWLDAGLGNNNNNGLLDVNEVGINGVEVWLFRDDNADGVPDNLDGDGVTGFADPDDAFRTDVTAANGAGDLGFYIFDGIPAGNYIVGIPPTNFAGGGAPLLGYVSSFPTDATDNGDDGDDNGINSATVPSTTGILSPTINVTRDAELPIANDPANNDGLGVEGDGRFGEGDDDSDLTVDFGFTPELMSIGNRVWYDADRDGIRDDGVELGLNDITVELFVDVDDDGVFEPGGDDGVALQTDVTHDGGYYIFDNLLEGNYFVRIAPEEFATGDLVSHIGTLTNVANPPIQDDNSNGNNPVVITDLTVIGLVSDQITLALTTEPTGEEANAGGTGDEGADGYGENGEDDNDSDLTIDFGVFQPMAIGNRVWNDNGVGGGINNNGIQDGGEVGFFNVVVNLYRDNDGDGTVDFGTVYDTVTTDGDGYYLFDNLPEGLYIVEIPAENFDMAGDPLFESFSSDTGNTEADGTPDQQDSGIDVALPSVDGVQSPPITLTLTTEPSTTNLPDDTDLSPDGDGTNGELDSNSDLTVDFGFVLPPMSIGNRLWFDLNNDGVIDPTETFVGGAQVDLYLDTSGDGIPQAAEFVATDTTDGDGYYLFDNLAPGNYIVVVDGVNFRAGGVLVNYMSTQSIPDPVDDDRDTLDPATAGNTDDGIDNLSPDVDGIQSAVIVLTPEDEYPDEVDKEPVEGDGTNGEEVTNSNLTIDFGFYKPMSIGNRVWFDTDGNGLIDPTENGAAGVMVSLFLDNDGNGAPDGGIILASELTDGDGYYLFDNLTPNDYRVIVDGVNFDVGGVLEGTTSTIDNVPNPPAQDNNDNGIDPVDYVAEGVLSEVITLALDGQPTGENDFSDNIAVDGPNSIGVNGETNNNSDISIDFGFSAPLMSVGNRVWIDANNDGLIDPTELGVGTVSVSLYPDGNSDGIPNGAAIDTVITDGDGYYLFENVVPGNYVIGLDVDNFDAGGALEGYFSTVTAVNNMTPPEDVYLAADDDSNDNGEDTLDPTYGILSNSFSLTFNSERDDEADLGPDGDGAGIAPENSDLTIDFGVFQSMAIGNRVWFDTDDSGDINGVEDGVANVIVNLYQDANQDGIPDDVGGNGIFGDADDILATDTTDGDGYYIFDGLIPDSYLVGIDAANFVGGGALVGSVSSTLEGTDEITDNNDNGFNTPDPNGTILSDTIILELGLEPDDETDIGPEGNGTNGEEDDNSNLSIDFGFVPGESYAIGNRVWLDIDGNGLRDLPSNTGIANVVMNLYRDTNSDGIPDDIDGNGIFGDVGDVIETEPTNVNGYYLFDGLTPGNYLVGVDPTNFDDGEALAGYASTLTGIANPPVEDDNDNRNTPTRDEPIDPIYGLVSDTIVMSEGTAPTGETDKSAQGDGTNGETDDNSDLTIDFGFYPSLTLGNRVWFDTDDSGTIDPMEAGIANVIVNLYQDSDNNGIPDDLDTSGTAGDAGDVLATDTTDGGGYYLFNSLPPGSYIVGVDAANFAPAGVLVGTSSSTGVATDPDTTDSNDNGIDTPDPNGHILSATVVLEVDNAPTDETDTSGNVDDGPNFRGINNETDNNSDLTIDFGFIGAPMSIGNRVWFDNGAGGVGVANDGLINGAEPGIGSVELELHADANNDGIPDSINNPIATTTTDAFGYYLFDGLPPGNYIVRVTPDNFQTGGELEGLFSSAGIQPIDTSSADGGIDDADAANNGILSRTIILEQDNEPTVTDEDDLSPNAARFGPDGRGTNGELDENSNLAVDFGFAVVYDWGDAPDTYGTTDGANGPNHVINTNIYLGNIVDDETDGQPSVAADGDDTNASDDEDSVDIPTLVAGTSIDLDVTVFNDTGDDATLIAWFDWDDSGTFDGGEEVSITVPSDPDEQVVQLTIDVPLTADVDTGGDSYVRIRFSTGDVSSPTGDAPDGEVEDYPIEIDPPGLSITKTDGQNSIVVGQETTYTITIVNSGTDALNRSFIDNLPIATPNGFIPDSITWTCTASGGASCIAGAAPNTNDSGTGNINSTVDIPTDGEIVYELTATLRPNYAAVSVTNTASIEDDDGSFLEDDDTNGVIFDPPIGRKIGTVLDDTRIEWTMVWINTGNPQQATIGDVLGANQTFAGNLQCTAFGNSVTDSCTLNNGTVTWEGTIGRRAPNRVEISFEVTVPGDGTYDNTATIDVGGETETADAEVVIGDPNDDDDDDNNDDDGVGIELLDPAIVKFGNPTLARPGELVTWTIQVLNPNDVPLSNITVSDTVSPDFEILSASATVGTPTVNGQEISLFIADIQANETITITVVTRILDSIEANVLENTAVLDVCDCTATAEVLVVGELPSTGETPWWRPILNILGLLTVVGLAAFGLWQVVFKKLRHNKAKREAQQK